MTRTAAVAALWLMLLAAAPLHAQDEGDGGLLAIAGGPFLFGSEEGEANEAPAGVRTLGPFSIQRTEVTNAAFRAFVAATGHRPSFFDTHEVLGADAHPVVGVSFDDAAAYCAHLGLRLPTEEEWERAARGASGRRYAWGEDPPTAERASRGAAACCEPDNADGYGATAPVGSFPAGATPEGILDLTGNVWEWVDGWYAPYDAAPGTGAGEFRVLRGGAWNSDDWRLRATFRLAYSGDFRYAANGGFRCARSH